MMYTDVFNIMNGTCISVNTRRGDNIILSSPEETCFTCKNWAWAGCCCCLGVLVLVFNCPAYSLKSILMPQSTAEARAE